MTTAKKPVKKTARKPAAALHVPAQTVPADNTPQHQAPETIFKKAHYIMVLIGSALFAFLSAQIIGPMFLTMLALAVGFKSDAIIDAFNDNVLARFGLILVIEVLTIWMVYLFLHRRKENWKDIGLARRPNRTDVGNALVMYGVYFLLFLGITIVLNSSHLIDTNQSQQLGFDNTQGLQLILVFVSLVILPPIAEEILFRGFIFMNLRKKLHFYPSVLITSVLFGMAHLEFGSGAPLNWAAAIDTFTLSCVLCYVTDKTKALWPGMIVHAINNSFAFVILFLAK